LNFIQLLKAPVVITDHVADQEKLCLAVSLDYADEKVEVTRFELNGSGITVDKAKGGGTTGARLTDGDKCVLVANFNEIGDASGGPMGPGDVGAVLGFTRCLSTEYVSRLSPSLTVVIVHLPQY
jgi:hypothetical protein